ncbi:MAG: peptidoglycan editing factor PgeF [Candidatus Omnitrophota bacterium]
MFSLQNKSRNKKIAVFSSGHLIKKDFFYYFKDWENLPVIAFFSNRKIDFSREKNREYLCRILGIERKSLVLPEQKHGGKVGLVNFKNINNSFSTDALVTQESGMALAVLTADCFPIFLYDPVKNAIGIVHAGWRGTKERILENTIVEMQNRFSTSPLYLKVAFGPGIRSCCYEVGEDLFEYFPEFIVERDKRFFLDLEEANFRQLQSLGIKRENIIIPAICTACQNEEFFSYRREGEKAGRNISVIMIKN